MQVNRTENKIILNQQEARLMIGRLDQIMQRDRNSTSAGGYEVRSLYFDTLTDGCVVEKEDGLLVHEKFRVRIYGTDDRVIKLESKRKVGEQQVKKSMPITREILGELCAGRYSVLLECGDPMGPYFFAKLSRGMRPKSIVQYQRLSFCLDTNNTRITFDSDIRATESCFDLFQDPLLAHPILPPELVVMEVKFNNFLLGYIKKTLSTCRKSPSSYSKYANGRTFYRSMI